MSSGLCDTRSTTVVGTLFYHPLPSQAITVREPVDREQHDSVTLTVRADDSGPNPLSSYAEVHVTIEDVNDNRCAPRRPHTLTVTL